jgi:hypothetical protein
MSNGYPDREVLEDLLRRYKPRVSAFEKPHTLGRMAALNGLKFGNI